MKDLFLRFTDQPEAIAVLQPLGMTYIAEVITTDANGDIIYTTKKEAVLA
jgi:hypothetical protein